MNFQTSNQDVSFIGRTKFDEDEVLVSHPRDESDVEFDCISDEYKHEFTDEEIYDIYGMVAPGPTMSKEEKDFVLRRGESQFEVRKFYEDHGFKVFPAYSIKNGTCNCYQGNNCSSSGKHPVSKNGFKDGARDYAFITGTTWDESNIGLVTGEENRLVVLDIDLKNGGGETFNKFIANSPCFQNTLKVWTGKYNGQRSFHFYFWLPEGVVVSSKTSKNLGVDLKANGGYVIGPGSRHKSGVNYEIDKTGTLVIEQMSVDFYRYLIETVFNNSDNTVTNSGKKMPYLKVANLLAERTAEGSRNSFLFSYACRLNAKKLATFEVNTILKSINQTHCNPPLAVAEVDNLLSSASRHQVELISTPKWSAESFSGLLADIAKEVTFETEIAPISVYAILIVLLGNYIGLRAKFKHVSSDLQTNLFLILIGLTKNGKKGAAQSAAEKVFKLVLDENDDWLKCIKKGVKTAEAIVSCITDEQFGEEKNVKSNQYEKIIICEGVRDKRLMIVETEFSKVLREASKAGSQMSETYRQSYDGGALSMITKTSPRSTSNSHISTTGHITPSELVFVRRKEDDFNGFGNRFLHIYSTESDRPISFPRMYEQWDLSIINKLKNIINWVNEDNDLDMKFSAAAKQVWEEFYIKHHNLRISEMVDSLNARNDTHVLKIAMILAIADCSVEIDSVHLNRAIDLINYSRKTIEYVYHTDEEKADINISKICTFLYNNGGEAKRSEISKKCFQKNKSSEDINELMTACIQKGRIEVSQSGKTETWSLKSRTTYEPLE